ncbi:MAG TPA: glycosyltransferase family 39 protein [Crinalium sp.]
MLTPKFNVQPRSPVPLLPFMSLLLLCVALFFWQLDGYSLFNITEAKQAEIARQIWVRHDWITPVYNGDTYFDKPILLHWLIALGFPVVGLNEWAVRLPSALSASALILGTYFFTAQFATQRTALLAATILAANPLTFALGRTGQHDMLMVCFMTGALYCWYWAYSTGTHWRYLAFFALLGLAVFAKGPLALVLCGLAIALFLLAVGQCKAQLIATPWLPGLLIFGSITLPWYILVIWANGWEFASNAFLYNNVDRFVSPNLNQVGPWYYYLPLLIIGFFPWIGLFPATWSTLRNRWAWLRLRYWRHRAPVQQINLFMVIWVLVVVLFMSASATKLPWYIYPSFPAIAYLCAQAWEQQIEHSNRWLKLNLLALSGLYLFLGIGLIVIPRLLPQTPILQSIEKAGTLQLWAIVHLITALVIGISAVRKQVIWVWVISVITFSIIALDTVHQLTLLDRPFLGGRLLAIADILHQETCDTCVNDVTIAPGVNEPSLNFYSRLSVIKRFDEPFDLSAIQIQLNQPKRILFVTTDETLNKAGLDFSQEKPVYVSDIYKLFILPKHR